MKTLHQNKFTREINGWISFMLTILFLLNSFDVMSQEKRHENEKFLIVLDVQQYWTDKVLSKEESTEMLNSINTLIEKTNPEKVIYVRTMAVARELSISFKGIKTDTLFAPDFDRNLKITGNNFFEKTEADAFATKELTDFLEQHHASEIIITGLLAENCINSTALGGLSRGYSIYLVKEAVGGKSDKSKNKVLKKLEEKGVKMLILNDLFKY